MMIGRLMTWTSCFESFLFSACCFPTFFSYAVESNINNNVFNVLYVVFLSILVTIIFSIFFKCNNYYISSCLHRIKMLKILGFTNSSKLFFLYFCPECTVHVNASILAFYLPVYSLVSTRHYSIFWKK